LDKKDGVVSQDMELVKLIGKQGTVVNDLRPAGRAEIDGQSFDVVSTGDYIEKGEEVIVSEVDGNRIVVKPIKK